MLPSAGAWRYAPRVPVAAKIQPLVLLWRQRLAAPVRRAGLALAVTAVFLAAHLARLGSPLARAAAAALLAAVLVHLASQRWWRRRLERDPRRALARVLRPAAPALEARAQRALTLLERMPADAATTSPALARLHFERLLGDAAGSLVEAAAARRAQRWRRATGVLVMGAAIAFVAGPMRIIEGLDVLLARGGTAPMPLVWLDETTLVTQPPAYLRREARWLTPGIGVHEAEGSVVTVRGTPRRRSRTLVLTDGSTEVPFLSDGAGGLVASYRLERDAELRIAARFGDVLVAEPDPIRFTTVTDASPEVLLGGAPRRVALGEVGDRLELDYSVTDDQGLRQVDLVLRSGGREERRVLVRLDGEVRRHAGGHAIDALDPFFRWLYLPAVVTIEARDNQPEPSRQWGSSAAITVIPPPIGKPEAERWLALAAGRDTAVDLLAAQLPGLQEGSRAAAPYQSAADQLERALVAAEAGLPVAPGLATFLRGQARVLRQQRAGTSPLRALEDVVLAVDVALRLLAERDAQAVSRRLGEVAEEVASGLRQARETERRESGLQRVEAACLALRTGGAELARLGDLGADLGAVIEGELGRIERARGGDDLHGAELGARHLAARLRRPSESFPSQHRGGVESGGARALDAGEASEADQRFDELVRELERLIAEHAAELGTVERALTAADRPEERVALREEARRRAEELQRAAAALPWVGGEPGSGRSAAARAREQISSMAQALERLSLAEAVERGRLASGSLEEASRLRYDRAVLEPVRRQVVQHLTWAEQELARLREQAETRSREVLLRSASRERAHAERASNLAGRGRNGESSLPEEVIERLERAEVLMREAAGRLEAGAGRASLELQRDAQRLLEQASSGETTAPTPGPQAPSGRTVATKRGEVPGEEGDRTQDFRRRVVEGLGGDRSGRLAPAVRRYAEGLLR